MRLSRDLARLRQQAANSSRAGCNQLCEIRNKVHVVCPSELVGFPLWSQGSLWAHRACLLVLAQCLIGNVLYHLIKRTTTGTRFVGAWVMLQGGGTEVVPFFMGNRCDGRSVGGGRGVSGGSGSSAWHHCWQGNTASSGNSRASYHWPRLQRLQRPSTACGWHGAARHRDTACVERDSTGWRNRGGRTRLRVHNA